MCPGIFLPGITRPGSFQGGVKCQYTAPLEADEKIKEQTWFWPMEPPDRCLTEVPWEALRPLKPCLFITPWKPFPILRTIISQNIMMGVHNQKKEGPKNVRDTLHINKLSRDKVSCAQFCPHGHHSIFADLELFQSVLWFHTRLPKMSKLLLCCRLFTPRTGTDLQSVVR